jgi:hypothetical protein
LQGTRRLTLRLDLLCGRSPGFRADALTRAYPDVSGLVLGPHFPRALRIGARTPTLRGRPVGKGASHFNGALTGEGQVNSADGKAKRATAFW